MRTTPAPASPWSAGHPPRPALARGRVAGAGGYWHGLAAGDDAQLAVAALGYPASVLVGNADMAARTVVDFPGRELHPTAARRKRDSGHLQSVHEAHAECLGSSGGY